MNRPAVALASAAALFFVLPLAGLLGRVSWGTLGADLSSGAARDGLWLSLVCSVGATVLSVIGGLPLAWVLARMRFPGRSLLRGLALLPLVLPPVVGGVALLSAFARRGFVGARLYEWFGVQLTFTTAGAMLAETFVAMPFFVLAAEAGFRSIDTRYEDAAVSLGARPFTVFRRVTFPMVAPSLAAGAVLAWARALGEFGATITFAGNIAGRTQTLPLAVYLQLESHPDVAIALSLVLVVVSLGVIVAMRDRWAV